MRCVRFLLPTVGLMLPLSIATARAPYVIENQTPADFAVVRRQTTQEIPSYLEASQCGGWDLSQSVEGKIATVTGVPGRSGDWDGALLSGMAVRSEDYQFPDATTGFVTTCDQGFSSIPKYVWDEPSHQYVVKEFGHPYFWDPLCRWRLAAGDPPIPLPPDAPFASQDFTEQTVNVAPDGTMTFGDRPDLSPPTCASMCEYLNKWQYEDCLAFDVIRDAAGDPVVDADGNVIFTCAEGGMGMRYLCTDVPVREGGSCMPGDLTGGPNARACVGSECRCGKAGDPGCATSTPAPQERDMRPVAPRPYFSYFRRYVASFFRDPVPQAADDQAAEEAIPVACYGFYDEFDPKKRQTHGRDRRCVLDIDVADRRETQKGKGSYGEGSNLPDSLPPPRDTSYDAETDLWYLNLGAGFSLLSEKVFHRDYDGDLSAAYLQTPDQAVQTTPPQLDSARPLAQSRLIRSFDDTAVERTIVTWWQKQQAEVSALLHRPVIRLLLPAGWALGADPFDPLLSPAATVAADIVDRRGERIEVQIDADEDTLGTALRALERSLILRVQEEPVPVVVPLGSPVEFRAVAEAWCLWWMRQGEGRRNCEDAPAEVRALRETLFSYADRIEDVRMLRGELARYAGELLALQSGLTRPLQEWVRAHVDAYRAILAEQRSIADAVKERWRPVQETMERYQSVSNRPWCMNQRFTLPIYSLLDTWMSSRAQDGSVRNTVEDYSLVLPSLTVPRPEDLIVDLSVLSFSTGSLRLPVLKPVQIRITDLPAPPAITKPHGLTDPLPQLPPIQPILDAVRLAAAALPDPPSAANAPVPPAPDFPPALGPQLDPLLASIDRMGALVTGMDERTRLFWESIGPLRPEERDAQVDVEGSHLWRKNHLQCADWDDALCQHVEMDLIERITRIASRPDVQLQEDYRSIGSEQVFVPCPPENDVCPPLHPEADAPRLRWEILGPAEWEDGAEQMRKAVRDATLPQPIGTRQPGAFPRTAFPLEEILPVYDVPRPIDLTPPSSVPSSAPTSP